MTPTCKPGKQAFGVQPSGCSPNLPTHEHDAFGVPASAGIVLRSTLKGGHQTHTLKGGHQTRTLMRGHRAPPQSTPLTEARTVENPILKWLRTPELGGPGRSTPQLQVDKRREQRASLSLHFCG
jgi:hypothetical protein